MPSRIAELSAVSLDCLDPVELAASYAALTGGKITHDDPEASAIVLPGGTQVIFLRVPRYQPPTWPDGDRPQQFHLDFDVNDLTATVTHAAERQAALLRQIVRLSRSHPVFSR
jgi:hypothetical protein